MPIIYEDVENENETEEMHDDEYVSTYPTDEEIYENLSLGDDGNVYYMRELYMAYDAHEQGDRSEDFWNALNEVIERRGDQALRVFYVNDHGNVCEYDRSGTIIEEWV